MTEVNGRRSVDLSDGVNGCSSDLVANVRRWRYLRLSRPRTV